MTDANRVRQAFAKLDFLVVIDLFKNQTARFADVILPASSSFEKTQLNRASMRNNPVSLQNQVIDWQGDSRPDWQILFSLRRRLGFAAEFPWLSAEEAIDYQDDFLPAFLGNGAHDVAHFSFSFCSFQVPSGLQPEK